MSGRILITPRSLSKGGHPALAPLVAAGFKLEFPAPGATPTEAQLIAALPGVVGWLAGVEKVSEAAIGAADRLRVISRNGTGIDNLPLALLGLPLPLFLVLLLAARGLSDTDHVDGEEPDDGTGHVSIGSAAAAPPGRPARPPGGGNGLVTSRRKVSPSRTQRIDSRPGCPSGSIP